MHVDSLTEMPRQGPAGRATAQGSLVDRNQGQVNHKQCDCQPSLPSLCPYSHCIFKVPWSYVNLLGPNQP